MKTSLIDSTCHDKRDAYFISVLQTHMHACVWAHAKLRSSRPCPGLVPAGSSGAPRDTIGDRQRSGPDHLGHCYSWIVPHVTMCRQSAEITTPKKRALCQRPPWLFLCNRERRSSGHAKQMLVFNLKSSLLRLSWTVQWNELWVQPISLNASHLQTIALWLESLRSFYLSV